METKANYALIGAFTIAGFLGILAFLMWFAKIELDRQFAYYDIYFPQVSGLGVSSEVTFAGVVVGKVVDIQLSDNVNGAVRVRIEVDDKTPVRTDSRASIEIQGVTGVSNVSITPGSPDAPLLRKANRDSIPVIQASPSVLQTLTQQGPEMISRLNRVAEQMTELLGPENQQRVRNILDNVERSSANLDKALSDVSKATDAIGKAADGIGAFGERIDTIAGSAQTTLANADAALNSGKAALDEVRDYVSGDLRGLTARLDETATTLRDELPRLSQRATGSLDRLDVALEAGGRAFDSADRLIREDLGPVATDLRATLARFSDSMGRIADDMPQITARLREAADSADAAFASLRAILDSARAPVQAFSREALPQLTRLSGEMRDLVRNLDQLVTTLRRNPTQILTGPRTPEFRR